MPSIDFPFRAFHCHSCYCWVGFFILSGEGSYYGRGRDDRGRGGGGRGGYGRGGGGPGSGRAGGDDSVTTRLPSSQPALFTINEVANVAALPPKAQATDRANGYEIDSTHAKVAYQYNIRWTGVNKSGKTIDMNWQSKNDVNQLKQEILFSIFKKLRHEYKEFFKPEQHDGQYSYDSGSMFFFQLKLLNTDEKREFEIDPEKMFDDKERSYYPSMVKATAEITLTREVYCNALNGELENDRPAIRYLELVFSQAQRASGDYLCFPGKFYEKKSADAIDGYPMILKDGVVRSIAVLGDPAEKKLVVHMLPTKGTFYHSCKLYNMIDDLLRGRISDIFRGIDRAYSRMALLDTGKSLNQPWGFVVSVKERNEDRILFVYPTKEQPYENVASVEEFIESMEITRQGKIFKTWREGIRFGISLRVLGSVIAPKTLDVDEINIKVDCFRFLGSWFKVNEESEESICISFVLSGHCSQAMVDSYLLVSRQIAGAICSLEKASSFVQNELLVMQRIHEVIDIDQSEGNIRGDITPFDDCLRESSLLRSLQRIFEDVFVLGNNIMYLDQHVQLNICIRSQALTYCTILPRKNKDLREMIENIKPYHTLIFVDDHRPSPDQHPLLLSFMEYYSPERSLDEIRDDMRCGKDQLMSFVHNLILWGQAVTSYPICMQNSYTIGEPNKASIQELAEYYDFLFPDPSRPKKSNSREARALTTKALAEILEFLAPVVSLEEYFVNASRFHPRAANMETVVFLLKTGLMIQLNVHIQFIEPTQTWLQGKAISKDLSPRIRTLIKNCHLLEENYREYMLLICSTALTLSIPEPEVFEVLGILISLIPNFLNNDYMEKIVYETKTPRVNVNRVIDLFRPMLFIFEIPASL